MGKVLLVACTNVGRYMIEELVNNNELKSQLVGVVDLNASQALGKANYDSYSDLAEKYGLPILYCDNVNDPEVLEYIRSREPDIVLQTGWSQKFLPELLSIPKYGCIGEHPAPLPRGRGAACVNWAILTGETNWGDTFFRMVNEYDKGDILAQELFEITENDSVFTVYEKVAASSSKIVRENIDNWTNGIFEAITQNNTEATHYKRRRPSDGEIFSFDKPAKTLHDFIRAQTIPYPCAYFMFRGRKIAVISSKICHGAVGSRGAGFVLSAGENGGILVECGNGEALELIRVRQDAAPSCWASDWAESLGIVPGDRLL